MQHFGTVESFDETKGVGFIKPEVAGKHISFERSAFGWEGKTSPPLGQRLSYELADTNGKTRAISIKHA